MKNKILVKFVAGLMLTGAMFACKSNNGNQNKVEITEEDKALPTGKSSVDYEDYGESDETYYDTNKWYKNDLQHLPLPDPCVYVEDGKYYIYGTTDATGARSFDCYVSENLNDFTVVKNIYKPGDTITTQSLFAPEVHKFGDKYYMYYSGGNGKVATGINVLVADAPDGSFKEYKGKNADGDDVDFSKEFLAKDIKSGKGLSILDVTVLEDGEDIYMYYSVYDTGIMQYIVGMQMKDPVTPDWDTYTKLIVPGALDPDVNVNVLPWECMKEFKVAEGPCVIKSPVNGKYYMTYSVNHYPDRYYTVCYAESDSPLGKYTKPYQKNGNWTNLLFGYAGNSAGTEYNNWEGFMSGCAHHNFFKVGDEYMIVYHAHKNRKDSNNGRMVAFDHLYFDKDTGRPFCEGPSATLQNLPTEISGYRNVAPKATIAAINVDKPEMLNDLFVTEHIKLSQEQNREAILNKGWCFIKVKLDKVYNIGGIQVKNSAFYDKYLSEIDYIKFDNANQFIKGVVFNDTIATKDEFIFPDSGFTVNLNKDVRTDTVTFIINSPGNVAINEIKILASEE
ncbi:MAG: family 43 glycosylhydrolase [Bacilli bacterium]|nr:family 43 glycosylhydrolase [Bacilli bacterium]